MKKISIVFLALIIATGIMFSGCDALDKLTVFNIPVSQEIEIKPTVPINTPFDIPTPPITLNTKSTFDTNNTNKDLIQEISLSGLSMSVTEPVGEDFSLLQSIEVYIAAEGETEEKIAWLNPVPAQSSVTLQMSNADLKRFILKDNITLKVKTVTDEVNTRTYKIKIDAKFKVNAKILGI